MTTEGICGGLSCGRRPYNAEGRQEQGCLRNRAVTIITALTAAAILVIACLGMSGVLSPLVAGAGIAGMGGGLFILRAVSSWRNSPAENRSVAPYCRAKVMLGLCGYAVLFGVLGATGVISGGALGWAMIAPVIAVAGPPLFYCCCSCACMLAYTPCATATGIALFGGPENEVRNYIGNMTDNVRNRFHGFIEEIEAATERPATANN